VINLGTLGNNNFVDAYFEVEVSQDPLAYGQTRDYYVRVNEAGYGYTDSPMRRLHVGSLVSQSRNSVNNMYLSTTEPPAEGPYGTAIANGGAMTLMVGDTYWITLAASTATNGYEQIQSFINFPNIIFQILAVTTTYTADTSDNVDNPSDMLYGDGCVWDSDPTSPNFMSCLSTGKVGGTVITTYAVKILQIPDAPLHNPEPLTTLIYDYSGNSLHYNSDFGGSTRYATIVNAGIEKSFAPKSINPNTDPAGTSTLTFTITNPGAAPITDVRFTDNLPTNDGTGQMRIADTAVAFSGFTVNPTPSSLTVGQTSLSFTGAEIPGFSSATIAVTVTTDETGIYDNVSENLIINTDIDTGDWAEDTLVATDKPPGPSTCDPRTTLATWTMPTSGQGSGGPPPPYTTKDSQVSFATARAGLTAAGSQSIVTGGVTTNAWQITDAFSTVTAAPGAVAPYFEFAVDSSNFGGLSVSFQLDLETTGEWASNANNYVYVYTSTDGTNFTLANPGGTNVTKGSWQPLITVAAPSSGVSTTWFRITAVTRGNKATSSMLLDNVTITGCPRPLLPTLTKTFQYESICQGGSSALTFTVTNPTGNSTTLTGLSFTDILPVGLVVATPNGLTGSCGGGTITAVPGSSTIELSGASLAPGVSCTFSVDVTGTAAGVFTNTSGSISSTETGVNTTDTGYGEDSLTVIAPPEINKTFGTTNLITGETTSLTFTITNPNPNGATSLTGVAFTDTLPAGLVVATPNGLTGGCGSGTITATAGSGTISLSGATLAGGGSCTFSVDVTGTTAGTYENTVQVTSAGACTGNTASATVIVRDLISSLAFQKQISTSSSGPWYNYMTVAVDTPLYYRFLVENTGETDLTSVAVSDPSLGSYSCTWQYVDSTGSLVPYSTQSPLTIPALNPLIDDEPHVAYCVPTTTITAVLGGPYTNTATASATGVPDATDIARYEGQNPTAVVIGRVALGYARVTDFLRSIGVPEIGIAELQNILRVWAPDSPAGESADRQKLLDALMAYLDPDGDGRVVVFRWETLEERGAIGFYADRLTDGTWVRINAGMLPGLIASPMGAEYWLADPGASPGNDYVYRLIEVEARGTTREYGPFNLRVDTPLP